MTTMARKKAKAPKKRAAAKKPKQVRDIRSLGETAYFFGVSTPTVQSWRRDGCPVVEGGGHGVAYKFDLHKVAAWRHDRDDADAKAAEERVERDAQLKLELLGDAALADVGDGPMTPKQRADYLRAELDRVKLAQFRRELVPADEIVEQMTDAQALARERIRGIPDAIAERLGLTEDDTAGIVELVDEILSDLADEMATISTAAAGNAPAA